VEVVLKGYPELAATRDHPEQQVLRELLDLQVHKDYPALVERPVLREQQGRQESLAQVEPPEVADYRVEVDCREVPERLARQEQPDLQVHKDYPALVVTPDLPVSQVQAERQVQVAYPVHQDYPALQEPPVEVEAKVFPELAATPAQVELRVHQEAPERQE